MWPIVGLSFFTVMLFVICLWMTRRAAVISDKLAPELEYHIRRRDYGSLLLACNDSHSRFCIIVRKMVLFLQRNPSASIEEIREVGDAEGARQSVGLTRLINWFSDIGTIAPMLGLLGTVIGMMSTFSEMAAGNFEGVKQMQMAGGIAQAMVTTAAGLVLAIPAMLCYFFFRGRVQKLIADMEVSCTHILSAISVQMDREQRATQNRVTRQPAAALQQQMPPQQLREDGGHMGAIHFGQNAPTHFN